MKRATEFQNDRVHAERIFTELVQSRAATTYPLEPTGIHPSVFGMMMGLYAYIMIVLWSLFGAHADGAIVLSVSTAFFVVYAASPLLIIKFGHFYAGARSFGNFLRGRVDTYTGEMTGMAALVQILTIPAGLALGITGVALIVLSQG